MQEHTNKENTQEMRERYMRRALALAEKGMGYVSPNPMVGCVVVKDGQIISEGFHERYGEYHAERNALLRCGSQAQGADLYVTLEPCCHYGKTPPCTQIIIEKGIRRVFVGAMDTNPLVGGKGIKQLQDAGIEVVTGILADACRRQNEVFFHYMEQKRPFVAMKYAMTLDGRIACASGDSRWVTAEPARNFVQQLRKRYSGIMVGIQTVLADDPMLTCRVAPSCSPVRLVCDSRLRIPLDSNLVRTAKKTPTWVACCSVYGEADARLGTQAEQFRAKKEALTAAGVRVLETSGQQVALREFLSALAQEKMDSILLEGGGQLNAGMLREGLVDRVYAFVAPKLVGGEHAPGPVGGVGCTAMADAYCLSQVQTQQMGEDFMITGLLQQK